MSGPDHKASLEPQELKMLCTQIRQIQKAMGDGIKKASKSEQKNINIVRKSLVAKKTSKKEKFLAKEILLPNAPQMV